MIITLSIGEVHTGTDKAGGVQHLSRCNGEAAVSQYRAAFHHVMLMLSNIRIAQDPQQKVKPHLERISRNLDWEVWQEQEVAYFPQKTY